MRNSPESSASNQNPSPFPTLLGQHHQQGEEKNQEKLHPTLAWWLSLSRKKQLFLCFQRPGEASPERSKREAKPRRPFCEKRKRAKGIVQMDGKGVSFEVWGWLIESEIENPRERGGTSHGEGMMMEIVHFLMPSFSLSLWLLCLNQEQCKHLS